MSDTPESLSAILAEFRQFALRAAEEDKMISPESVLLLADRIEAAAKFADAMCRKNEEAAFKRGQAAAPGNAAAMREALDDIQYWAKRMDEKGCSMREFVDFAREKIESALSAPARNCDRFASIGSAIDGFCREVQDWEDHDGIPDYYELVKWLFATEGGDHA